MVSQTGGASSLPAELAGDLAQLAVQRQILNSTLTSTTKHDATRCTPDEMVEAAAFNPAYLSPEELRTAMDGGIAENGVAPDTESAVSSVFIHARAESKEPQSHEQGDASDDEQPEQANFESAEAESCSKAHSEGGVDGSAFLDFLDEQPAEEQDVGASSMDQNLNLVPNSDRDFIASLQNVLEYAATSEGDILAALQTSALQTCEEIAKHYSDVGLKEQAQAVVEMWKTAMEKRQVPGSPESTEEPQPKRSRHTD